MGKIIRIFWSFIVMECFLVLATKAITVQEKAEAAVPVTTLSPPEGNTTFLNGTNWCVARPGVPQADLQNALDWACGLGMADCRPIRAGGSCFQPDTLLSHASFAFNSYYQKNSNSDIACNFGGTAMLTNKNPSYGNCTYATSGSSESSAPALCNNKQRFMQWKFPGVVVLLLYLGS